MIEAKSYWRLNGSSEIYRVFLSSDKRIELHLVGRFFVRGYVGEKGLLLFKQDFTPLTRIEAALL